MINHEFVLHRHHTNPVGTEWKWKMDDPQTILDGALASHINLIRQFRGTGDFMKLPFCKYYHFTDFTGTHSVKK